jgi:SAM-dependent methyltransferase
MQAPLKRYSFEAVAHCEMCGFPDSKNSVLGQRLNCRQGFSRIGLTGISVTIKRCISCGLIYANPLPIPSSISDHYHVPPEDYWSQDYFSWDSSYFERQIKDYFRLSKKDVSHARPAKALDIGCGIGKALRSLVQANIEAWGIEPSSTFCARAREFTGLDESRIINSSIEGAVLPESEFDFVSFGAVFEHLYHPRVCLEKALAWCKPGGIVHIEVPSSRWLIETIYQGYLKLTGSQLCAYLSPMHSPFHLYSFSRKSFVVNKESMGFRLMESRVDPCTVYYFPAFMKPLISRFMGVTGTGMQLTVYLQKI